MNKKLPLTVLCLVVVFIGYAQQVISANQGYVATKDYLRTIPYYNINNKVIIKVSLEGISYDFLLDTGAPTSISERVYSAITTNELGKINLMDISGISDSVTVVSVPEIDIDGIKFMEIPAFVRDEKKDRFFQCLNIDGIIGSNLLRNSTIQFDGAKQQVTLTDDSKKLNLKKRNATDLKLNDIQSNPFIPIQLIKNEYVGNEYVLFDSGDNGFYALAQETYKQLDAQIEVFETIAKANGSFYMGIFGTANKEEHRVVKIATLNLGKTDFENVITKTTYGQTSRIGAQLFKYGKVTLDYKKGRFWFEKYTDAETIVLEDKVWPIEPVLDNENTIVIGVIWDDTLTDKLKLGDQILSIDAISYEGLDFCEIMNSGFKVNKTTAVLRVRDKDTQEIKEVTLHRL